MKSGQFIELPKSNVFFKKKYAENGAGKLVPDCSFF